MMLVACSKAPGAKDTGYRGIPWGADAGAVAKTLGVPPHTAGASALFASHYQATAPKLGALMEKGFANFLIGTSGANPVSLGALKGMTVLDAGKKGYSLFFNGKFGMNVRPIPASEYPADHDRLMKRYGVIDKKVDYMPDEHQSAYFIMWHDADGKILLAKEVYQAAPDHEVTACQIIHIDKRVFNAISGELSAAKASKRKKSQEFWYHGGRPPPVAFG